MDFAEILERSAELGAEAALTAVEERECVVLYGEFAEGGAGDERFVELLEFLAEGFAGGGGCRASEPTHRGINSSEETAEIGVSVSIIAG